MPNLYFAEPYMYVILIVQTYFHATENIWPFWELSGKCLKFPVR